jgi:para-aminobenzoate synthetase component I
MSGTAIDNFIDLMNKFGAEKEPFMFIVDFHMNNAEIHKLSAVPSGIKYITPLLSNISPKQIYTKPVSLIKHPVPFNLYSDAFKKVMENIRLGNSYLLNLTFQTLIETEFTLEEIFYSSFAKYKLLYHNCFVVFSPEIFVRINDGEIKSFPMKGTIDSSVHDAEKVIMNDEKEEAEHNTIIDLIRNDLSKVADNVVVTRYRYIDRIKSGASELLQVSSEISGFLKKGYENHIGDIIAGLLPAGSEAV